MPPKKRKQPHPVPAYPPTFSTLLAHHSYPPHPAEYHSRCVAYFRSTSPSSWSPVSFRLHWSETVKELYPKILPLDQSALKNFADGGYWSNVARIANSKPDDVKTDSENGRWTEKERDGAKRLIEEKREEGVERKRRRSERVREGRENAKAKGNSYVTNKISVSSGSGSVLQITNGGSATATVGLMETTKSGNTAPEAVSVGPATRRTRSRATSFDTLVAAPDDINTTGNRAIGEEHTPVPSQAGDSQASFSVPPSSPHGGHSPHRPPSIILPSGSYIDDVIKHVVDKNPDTQAVEFLTQSIVFPYCQERLPGVNHADRLYLSEFVPALAAPPNEFSRMLLDSAEEIDKRTGTYKVPEPQWLNIKDTFRICYRQIDAYIELSTSRAEGLMDGFWNLIIDAFFIDSTRTSPISLDRKEVESICTGPSRFDTVFVPFHHHGLRSAVVPLGFMEVKPPRYLSSTKPARVDFEKVVKALRSTLKHLNPTVEAKVREEIVLVGVLCDGWKFTVIQARNGPSGYYMFKSFDMYLSRGKLVGLFKLFWQIRATLERTCRVLTAAWEKDTSGFI